MAPGVQAKSGGWRFPMPGTNRFRRALTSALAKADAERASSAHETFEEAHHPWLHRAVLDLDGTTRIGHVSYVGHELDGSAKIDVTPEMGALDWLKRIGSVSGHATFALHVEDLEEVAGGLRLKHHVFQTH
jgi:hypothetical protein